VNQSRLFDPFIKSHGSFVPLVILAIITSLLSIIALELLNHVVYQEAAKIVKENPFLFLKDRLDSK